MHKYLASFLLGIVLTAIPVWWLNHLFFPASIAVKILNRSDCNLKKMEVRSASHSVVYGIDQLPDNVEDILWIPACVELSYKLKASFDNCAELDSTSETIAPGRIYYIYIEDGKIYWEYRA